MNEVQTQREQEINIEKHDAQLGLGHSDGRHLQPDLGAEFSGSQKSQITVILEEQGAVFCMHNSITHKHLYMDQKKAFPGF